MSDSKTHAELTAEALAAVVGGTRAARADRLSHGVTKKLSPKVSKRLSTKIAKWRGRGIGGFSGGVGGGSF